MRVAMLVNILSPYRVPLFRELQNTPGWLFKVFTCAETEHDRSWHVPSDGVNHKRAWSVAVKRRVWSDVPIRFEQILTLHFPFGLLWDLSRFSPDVVVCHELGPRAIIALLYCTLFRKRFVIWSYNSLVSVTQASPLRQLFRRWLLRRAETVIGMQTEARAVLRELGVPNDKIFDAPNSAAHERLQTAATAAREKGKVQELIRRLGLRKNVAICVGRLAPLKGISELLAAWRRVPRDLARDWSLLLVGDGPLEEIVKSSSQSEGPEGIVYAGHVDPDDVAAYYAASNLAIFASLGDVWGLVVNEALACGLPVVCSEFAGCAVDLIQPGRTGWTYAPTDPRDFDRTLQLALRRADKLHGSAEMVDSVSNYSIEAMADGIRRAVQASWGSKKNDAAVGTKPALAKQ